jgi:hypothetical protein
MSKMKEVFTEERERESQSLGDFIDDTYQEGKYSADQTRRVLNDIFEAWGEIFGVQDVTKIKSNDKAENL